MAKGKKGSAFADRLANLGKRWKEAKENPVGAFVDIPPGIYNFQLIGADIRESENKSWLHAAFRFACITEGQYLGCTFVHRCGLEGENSINYLQRDLQRLGVSVEDIELNAPEALEELLEEIAGEEPCIRGKIVEKGEFTNLYIQKLLDLDPDDIPPYTVGGEVASFPPSEKTDDGSGGDDDDPPVSASSEIEVGDRVSADFDGDDYEGVVEKVSRGKATVKFDDGDTDTFAVGDLQMVAKASGSAGGPDGGVELEVGMSVVFEYRGRDIEGKVVKIDEEKAIAHVDTGKSKPSYVDFKDLEVLAD
jgi:hypothetical protein